MTHWSYRTKLMVGVCALVFATGTAVIWLAHRSAEASAERLARSLFKEVSGHAATHTRSFVLRAQPLVKSLVELGAHGLQLDDSDELAKQLLAIISANGGLSWVSYGDEAGNFTGVYRPVEGGLRINQSRIVNGRTHLVEHDVMPGGAWRRVNEDDDSGYDPRKRPFYEKAKAKRRLVWLPPYIFYTQEIPGISCAAPVYDDNNRLRGVLSIDFVLESLSEFAAQLSPSEQSKVFLFTSDDVLLAYPGLPAMERSRHRQGKLPTLADTGDEVIEQLRTKLPSEREGLSNAGFRMFELPTSQGDHLASIETFPIGEDLVWFVGVIAPKSDFLGDVWTSQSLALAVAGGALLIAVVLAAGLARRVSGPVVSLIGFMRRVGEGDLDAQADFGGSREFRELSSALNRMILDLRDRLRMRHSLDVAMQVQKRLLPSRPPTFQNVDVAGHSTYCDETGGDYYDFLILEEAAHDTLLVALGDVMGHGVAAALVMAGARAVLRDRVQSAGGLAGTMDRLNRLLAADHEGTRFMTMHLASLNTAEGIYRWVSAGHDPAIIYDPSEDRFEEIDAAELPLGVMEETEYVESSCSVRPGQIILIGTDGLWESPNEAGEQFGKERLRDAIRAAARLPAHDIVQAILQRLSAFRGNCRQVDDITFVVVKPLDIEARIETTPPKVTTMTAL